MEPQLGVPVCAALTEDERSFLVHGLGQWGGPAAPTDQLAVAMGFESVSDLREQGGRLVDALHRGDPLTPLDWTRVLVSAEVNFASDVFGSGAEWETVTPLSDELSLRLLRSIQRKLVTIISGALVGHRPDRF